MIVQIINIQHIYAIKPENDPEIFVHFHRPETCQIPRKLMKPITGNIHLTWRDSRIQAGQDQANFGNIPFEAFPFEAVILLDVLIGLTLIKCIFKQSPKYSLNPQSVKHKILNINTKNSSEPEGYNSIHLRGTRQGLKPGFFVPLYKHDYSPKNSFFQ